MIEVRTHTLTISMMANASTTAAFRGGKVSPAAATTWSAGSPPPLITCKRSFPAGFNSVVFILLVVLVLLGPIVAFAFMMMVVDNRNVRASIKRRLPRGCCSHVTTTRISRQSIVLIVVCTNTATRLWV